MTYFRVVAEDASYCGPVIRVVTSAAEAQRVLLTMTRMCAPTAVMTVSDKRGRIISAARLMTLIRGERALRWAQAKQDLAASAAANRTVQQLETAAGADATQAAPVARVSA